MNSQNRHPLHHGVSDELPREALLARDVAAMRRSIQQFNEGKRQEVNEFFDGMRFKLLAMQGMLKKGNAK